MEKDLAFAIVRRRGPPGPARAWTAPWIAPEAGAAGKAWTAAAYGAERPRQGEKMKELHAFGASISAATHGRFTPQIGGLPITERRRR